MQIDTLIIGEGWGARVAALLQRQQASSETALWISGSGRRLQWPLPFLSTRKSAEILSYLADCAGQSMGSICSGSFLRELKPGGFESVEQRPEDSLFYSLEDFSFETPLNEIALRFQTTPEPLSVEWLDVAQKKAKLSSGKELQYARLVFADRWSEARRLGVVLPKLSLMSVLQLTFEHKAIWPLGIREGFTGWLPKEVGQEDRRTFMGWVEEGTPRSHWTLLMETEEGEDNHEVAKKIRRLKQTLSKLFQVSHFLGEKQRDFTDSILSEKVLFEESAFLPQAKEVAWSDSLLLDVEGPSRAIERAWKLLGSGDVGDNLKQSHGTPSATRLETQPRP